MHIERPTLTRVHYANGDTSYSISTPSWSNEYIRNARFGDVRETGKRGKEFLKEFNRLADEIERTNRPHNIMRPFVQRNLFKSVRKLNVDVTTI